jgi:hypothetical protein
MGRQRFGDWPPARYEMMSVGWKYILTPDDFVTSLSVDAWRSYRDVARQHLLQR